MGQSLIADAGLGLPNSARQAEATALTGRQLAMVPSHENIMMNTMPWADSGLAAASPEAGVHPRERIAEEKREPESGKHRCETRVRSPADDQSGGCEGHAAEDRREEVGEGSTSCSPTSRSRWRTGCPRRHTRCSLRTTLRAPECQEVLQSLAGTISSRRSSWSMFLSRV